jgi:sigma-E factor negative regulatory protein RseB
VVAEDVCSHESTMRITHVVDEHGVHERLYSITGPQREVIRDKDGVRCVLGDEKSIMEDPVITGAIFPDIPLENLEEDNAQYVFSTREVTRVAGHKARMVSIKPVDKFRYGYDFWLEEHSGLLLKWVLYETSGKPLARMMFTDMQLGSDINHDELISSIPPEEFIKLKTGMPDSKSLSLKKPKWIPSALPAGFKLAAHSIQEQEGDSVFEHQVYSDGLASVSVYIEDQTGDAKAVTGPSKIGTANAYSRKVGKKQVTVIGEVPQKTVRDINIAVVAPVSER